ncbi:MAG TPA: BMP family ABC transporter substrate-binding protein [Acidimicrobiia bacterium]|nr:BMP family ABC transporter substrate-binding protein [Acidimicrobiia bacterium]
MKKHLVWLSGLLAMMMVVSACGDSSDDTTTTAGGSETTTTEMSGEPLTFGMILVGPQDDRGWSQAHREAGEYLEEKLGATMIVLDKVNPADRPEQTVDQVARDMIEQGAQLIFMTSDDMKDGALLAAEQNPDVPMIWSSGDNAWEEGKDYRPDLANLGNVMGEMEYGKMIAGCSAALATETGSIGYVGPLINDETRRLVSAAYLGAKHCWTEVLGNDAADLTFAVNWIGFWFNIPGVTLDPTLVSNDFIDGGADVLISGIDTTEALVVAGQRSAAGDTVWAVPYDYVGACDGAPEVCLGTPWFNWGPSYLEIAQSVLDGTFEATFQWLGPDWSDLNNPDTTAIGWVQGPGATAENAAAVDAFIAGLADGSINLWTGPINNQDGSVWLAEGETATPQQIWYMEQLLEGIDGASQS